MLDVLSARPRVAFNRRRRVERVWGEDWFGDDHIGDVHSCGRAASSVTPPTVHATS